MFYIFWYSYKKKPGFAYTSAQDVLHFVPLRKSPRAYAVKISEFGSDDTQTATPRS